MSPACAVNSVLRPLPVSRPSVGNRCTLVSHASCLPCHAFAYLDIYQPYCYPAHWSVEEIVEHALLTEICVGDRDEIAFEALFKHVARDARVAAAGRAAVMHAVEAMDERSRVMQRDGVVHLI